jgi:hypothetical protein
LQYGSKLVLPQLLNQLVTEPIVGINRKSHQEWAKLIQTDFNDVRFG